MRKKHIKITVHEHAWFEDWEEFVRDNDLEEASEDEIETAIYALMDHHQAHNVSIYHEIVEGS